MRLVYGPFFSLLVGSDLSFQARVAYKCCADDEKRGGGAAGEGRGTTNIEKRNRGRKARNKNTVHQHQNWDVLEILYEDGFIFFPSTFTSALIWLF